MDNDRWIIGDGRESRVENSRRDLARMYSEDGGGGLFTFELRGHVAKHLIQGGFGGGVGAEAGGRVLGQPASSVPYPCACVCQDQKNAARNVNLPILEVSETRR